MLAETQSARCPPWGAGGDAASETPGAGRGREGRAPGSVHCCCTTCFHCICGKEGDKEPWCTLTWQQLSEENQGSSKKLVLVLERLLNELRRRR